MIRVDENESKHLRMLLVPCLPNEYFKTNANALDVRALFIECPTSYQVRAAIFMRVDLARHVRHVWHLCEQTARQLPPR